ncbi:MAG: AMP-binding protein [Alphaproteobacteria bacterium]|nr:AMP-binding protein [Alphaproteobacteria bacterium]
MSAAVPLEALLELLGTETIPAAMERRAASDPGHVYCWFGGRPLSYGVLNATANRLANALLRGGLRPGDRVALMLPSHPDHIVAIAALMKAGFVRVPVNAHYKGAALDQVFDQFKPQALIVDAAYAAQIEPVLHGSCAPRYVAWRREGGEFAALCADADGGPPAVLVKTDDILALTPSSGTTGASKGVLKSDRTLRAGPVGIRVLTEFKPADVFLLWEPLHHGAGVAVAIAALLWPISLAMVERFSASRFWDEVRRYGVTHIHYLGGVLPLLLKQPRTAGDRGHKVRIACGGGCPPDVWEEFAQRFGVTMREGYGLSELITFVTVNTESHRGSIGRPLSFYDIRLADDRGEPVAPGETGEIVVRSRAPGLGFLGYYENPGASRATMDGEWCRTGDLARADDQGRLYFAGRKKDVIRRRGVNVAAWEVERVIATHADIEECALVGVPSELGEEDLKLFVRPVPGQSVDPLELVRWCEPRLPYFQVPRYIAFIEEFPKTPTQRIRKAELSRAVDCWDVEKSGHVLDRGRVA